ncbi:alkylated DNA repair dioxygenase AlkB [Pseudomonas sp. BIGb0408]|uniref:Alkylated DNA repair dioxygenase AlkB n=1 Tax=Phytopseudomonas flavescens TaxID=29435 RepID=A0A7Z0BMH1_9GAMM|nr:MULTISPECIES: alpha-ketoglutarate-dependent dioxygenase AlkB [Pseudomonas]MCW2293605.1 alkylated DNA repair dioxygenase AlkB [Pseudomonas sp. BIGb0408]NYH71825.1 alkylated DNA repair dioxygenase AlkB [Pseudomonas flavescens]
MSGIDPTPADLFDSPDLNLADADLRYLPAWLDRATADHWLERLVSETPWQQPEVVLYGRRHPVPRLTAWYGDTDARYRYSGMTHQPLPWTPLLAEIRQRLVEMLGCPLNGALLNYYRDGQDSMGWHSDGERELGDEPLVVSLSLGGERRFDLRRKGHNRIEHSLTLAHGSLLVMGGQTQHHWQHQVAKTRKPCAPRLNLTFRLIRAPL